MTDDTDLTVKLRRLSKLLDDVVKRLEELEGATALTAYIQDELTQHVERLLDYVAEQREPAKAAVRRADVFANSTEHEEYRPS